MGKKKPKSKVASVSFTQHAPSGGGNVASQPSKAPAKPGVAEVVDGGEDDEADAAQPVLKKTATQAEEAAALNKMSAMDDDDDDDDNDSAAAAGSSALQAAAAAKGTSGGLDDPDLVLALKALEDVDKQIAEEKAALKKQQSDIEINDSDVSFIMDQFILSESEARNHLLSHKGQLKATLESMVNVHEE